MTGNQLKQIREQELDMTQLEFANAIGKWPGTVARWEQYKDDEIPDSRLIELVIKGLRSEKDFKTKRT
jgi:DNA-binding transcriptional regulator YiaG